MAEDDIFVRRLFERIRAVEWNEAKAASNRRKHGVDFDEAIEVFFLRDELASPLGPQE